MSIEIHPYHEKFRSQVIMVWERSVTATHHFVSKADMAYFKSMVEQIDFNSFTVYCLVNENTVIGFIGVADHAIEMLFLDPAWIGKGFGKKLMQFAIDDLKVNKVDVNEQNQHAVSFYTAFGFSTYERTDKDPQGKDYPILKMKLVNQR